MAENPVLRLENLGKGYAAGRPLFERLSLDLEPGAYVAIMGESGVGKSTLLNLLAGLDEPDAAVPVDPPHPELDAEERARHCDRRSVEERPTDASSPGARGSFRGH